MLTTMLWIMVATASRAPEIPAQIAIVEPVSTGRSTMEAAAR